MRRKKKRKTQTRKTIGTRETHSNGVEGSEALGRSSAVSLKSKVVRGSRGATLGKIYYKYIRKNRTNRSKKTAEGKVGGTHIPCPERGRIKRE